MSLLALGGAPRPAQLSVESHAPAPLAFQVNVVSTTGATRWIPSSTYHKFQDDTEGDALEALPTK